MIKAQSSWAPIGALTIETALATLAQGQEKIASANGILTLDLAKIDMIDSVGVAVLLEWKRFANIKHTQLLFINPPAKLRSMLNLSELEDILQVAS